MFHLIFQNWLDANLFTANPSSGLRIAAAEALDGGEVPGEVRGGPENDVLVSFSDVSYLAGGGGDDWLFTGAGNDWLNGGSGNDRLTAGAARWRRQRHSLRRRGLRLAQRRQRPRYRRDVRADGGLHDRPHV